MQVSSDLGIVVGIDPKSGSIGIHLQADMHIGSRLVFEKNRVVSLSLSLSVCVRACVRVYVSVQVLDIFAMNAFTQ